MKHSRKAPLTLEDVRIWSEVGIRGYQLHGLLFTSGLVNPDSDERDAELMLDMVERRSSLVCSFLSGDRLWYTHGPARVWHPLYDL
jgi:hypothetical protein